MDAVRKSALYRQVNLATEALLVEYGSDEDGHFLCECLDGTCSRRLELPRVEFEAVRWIGGRLVSLDCIDGAKVLHRGGTYAAVEAYCSSIEK